MASQTIHSITSTSTTSTAPIPHHSHIITPFINQLHPKTNINSRSILGKPYTMLSAFNAATSEILLQLRTSYVVPAILLNPAFLVHCLNTFVSRSAYSDSAYTPSVSPYPTFESLGPVPNAPILFDVHAHDGLLWAYTLFSVMMQLWAFGRVTREREVVKRSGKLNGGMLGLQWESKTIKESTSA